ncbi:MAG: type I 3-dehydroquinate dehydratase [Spirochaetia bacterium]|nr:type I 3-dehydroquinate dehydratase [Spirochaetia bacterium]
MSRLCLSLTASTIDGNLAALERYRGLADLCELRVDCLEPQEWFAIRRFPRLAGIPVILTVRRKADGGLFEEGEGVRLVILAKGLSFASQDPRRNFAYIDIESDFRIPALEEAARTFGTRIIRSMHFPKGMPDDLDATWRQLEADPAEIPKLAATPRGVADLTALFRYFADLPHSERVVVGMGDYGFCTRVLAEGLGSSITYASALAAGLRSAGPGHVDPSVLDGTYRWRQIGRDFAVFGILGGSSVLGSLSPAIHNAGFAARDLKAVYLPFPADSIERFLELADFLHLRAFSVTVPFKERILPWLVERTTEVDAIGACNTVVRSAQGWTGANTDSVGFEKALFEFLGTSDLAGLPCAIIGAGGAARAAAWVLSRLGADVCVVNRNMTRAKALAERFGFEWSGMTERAVELLSRHKSLIVQCTTVGMEGGPPGDPLDWYDFDGSEAVFDTIYNPAVTPFLARARAAGCRTAGGIGMLRHQAEAQFVRFTGLEYPEGAADEVLAAAIRGGKTKEENPS